MWEGEEYLLKKQQISRILDIDDGIQPQNIPLNYAQLLNGESPTEMAKEKYHELTPMTVRSRIRNLSTGSEGSSDSVIDKPLFGQKNLIDHDVKEGDSLQKLALTYNCSVGELKHANKIYRDFEFAALNKVKIPVVKGGQLEDHYKSKLKSEEQRINTSATPNIKHFDNEDKFKAFNEHEIRNDWASISDDDDINYINASDDETDILLLDRTKTRKSKVGQPIDGSGLPMNQFINDIDKKLEKNSIEADQKIENVNELVNSMGGQVIFPMGPKPKPDYYGTVGFFTWGHFAIMLCLVAVVAPVLYFLYFYNKSKS